jgi:hypothetical protein
MAALPLPATPSPDPAAAAGDAVDYAERAARSVTVTVLPSVTLAQVDRVFRAAGLPVEISFRLGKRAACVTLATPDALDAALALAGTSIQPKSSAALSPCVIEIEPGVVKPPVDETKTESSGTTMTATTKKKNNKKNAGGSAALKS